MPISAPVPDTSSARGDASPPPGTLSNDPPWALFLDLDGTLCAFQDDPARVALSPAQARLIELLDRRLDGALCVLSGRGAEDLDRALQPLRITRVGDHGHDVRMGLSPDIAAQLDDARAGFEALSSLDPSLSVEHKQASCALHYRRAPHLAPRLIESAREIARELMDLRLLEGNRVLEVGPAQSDKGRALRRLMREPTFRGRRPIAVGDDVTDEDAFVAAAALGGFGIAVGARPSRAARHHLADCDAVNAWLAGLAQGGGDAEG